MGPRLGKIDRYQFKAAVVGEIWGLEAMPEVPVNEMAEQLRGILTDVCEASMPRVAPRPRRAAPWWTEEIAQLRTFATEARKELTRTTRRHRREPDAVFTLAPARGS